jgi:flagellar biosynthesis protein FlhA
VPGLPKIPFFFVGGILIAAGLALRKQPNKAERAAAAAAAPVGNGSHPHELPAAPRDAALDALALDPLELAIGFGLVPMVDQQAGGTLLQPVSAVRKHHAGPLGTVVPKVPIHDEVGLGSHE